MEQEPTIQQEQPVNGADVSPVKPPVSNLDIPGPPFTCPECVAMGNTMHFKSRPAVAVHRRVLHGHPSDSATSNKSYYQRAKERKAALAAETGEQTRTYKKRSPTTTTEEQTDGRINNDSEDQLANHVAFAAGYITCFIETYAKGHGLSGYEFASRVANVLHPKSR